MKSTRRATTVAVALASLLTICAGSVSSAAAKSGATVTISVASLIPGSTPEAKTQFNNQVLAFQKANPNIKIKPVE